MISQKNYDILKEKYGDASSWAVWNTDYADSKPSRNINDLSVFDSPNLSELNTGFVFVGLNRSGKPKDGNAEKSRTSRRIRGSISMREGTISNCDMRCRAHGIGEAT